MRRTAFIVRLLPVLKYTCTRMIQLRHAPLVKTISEARQAHLSSDFALAAIFFAAGCATPYKAEGLTGGYTDTQSCTPVSQSPVQ